MVPSSDEEADRELEKPPTLGPVKSYSSKINDYWVWEVVSCIGSVIALAAVIGVLLEYNGKALPDWPYGITINSVLSWITQFLTTCMVAAVASGISQYKWLNFSTGNRPLAEMNSYDWASRGPLGCTAFLWTSRLRYALNVLSMFNTSSANLNFRRTTALGALITVLALGVGPFVQQMAAVKNIRIDSDIPAFTHRSESFKEGKGDVYTPPTTNMMAAIYGALFANSDTTTDQKKTYPSVTPDCPTGNCDIPPFQTLASCSKCADISHMLSLTIDKLPCWNTSVRHTHSLPNGLSLRIVTSNREENVSSSKLVSTDTDFYFGLQPDSNIFGDSAFLTLSAITIAPGAPLSKATATHCWLYWCVNTYSSSVDDHRVQESLLDTYYDVEAQYENLTLQLHPPARDNLIASNFTVDYTASDTVTNWFNGKMVYNNTWPAYCNPDGTFSNLRVTGGTEFVQPMLDSSFPHLFDGLAKGVTAHVRMTNLSADHAPGVEPAHGASWTVQTVVQVRWAWVTLPAVLIILTMVFLVLAALESRTRGVEVWKSSTVPLLCSGLDQSLQQELRAVGDPIQIEGITNGVRARLVKGEGGMWRLDSKDTGVLKVASSASSAS